MKVVDAHNGPVACIAELDGGVVTGGKDGFVSCWDPSLRRTAQWNMNGAEPGLHGVNKVASVAVCGGTVMAACINSTTYRMTVGDDKVESVFASHFGDLAATHQYGELWALAADPKGPRFATGCDDATLRVWDAPSHRCVARVDIGATAAGGPARALAWSPDGRWVVAGFLQGSIAVFDANDSFTELMRLKKRKRRIQCLSFSPNSKFLAVGSAENQVDVYDADDDFRRVHVAGGKGIITSVVMQIDWSEDSKFIQTTSQAYELMHFEIRPGEPGSPKPLAGLDMRDMKWATMTGVLGWDVQGIWSSRDFDGSDINAVSRSNAKQHLVTADTYGRVKVFNYPCVGGGFNKSGQLTRRPECNWVVPSTNATNVAWSADDQYVYSTGGHDLSVFQWKVVPTGK